MGRKLTIFNHRITYVKGEVTTGTPAEGLVACGPGTAYPMLVTVDQLAEILYRVRDAQFVAGEIVVLFPASEGWDYDVYNTSSFSFGPMPAPLWETSDYAYDFMIRGYCTSVISYDPPNDPNPMPNYGDGYFGDYYTYTDGFGEYVKIREAIQELSLWAAREDPPNTFSVGSYDLDIPVYFLFYYLYQPVINYRTGLSYCAQEAFGTVKSGYPYGISDSGFPSGGSTAYLNFSGMVAWVDENNSGDPHDPNNKLYIGMVFAQGNEPVIISTLNSTEVAASVYSSASPVGVDFEIELSGVGNVVSCPLYWFTAYDPSSGATIDSATPYRIKATAWWPYAYENGSPNWNRFDGSKLDPFTPLTANFDNVNNANLIPVL